MVNGKHGAFPDKELSSKSEWLTFLLFGHSAFQYLHAGCELGLFDHLAKAPGASLPEVGRALALAPHSARGLLFGLSALGLVQADAGRYRNGGAVAGMMADGQWETFKISVRFEAKVGYLGQIDLVESLRTASNAGLRRFPGSGPDLYHRLAESAELREIFYEFVSAWSKMAIPKMIKAVDLSGVGRVLDVGGGDATIAIAMAEALPRLNVTVLELAENADVPRGRIRAAGLDARVDVVERDMFAAPFPRGYDCVSFVHQLVIWPEDKNQQLIERAYECLPSGGKVVIMSSMSDDGEAGPVISAMDSAYFLSTPVFGGLIYPWKDYEGWLQKAGFVDIKRHRLDGWTPHGAIVARKN